MTKKQVARTIYRSSLSGIHFFCGFGTCLSANKHNTFSRRNLQLVGTQPPTYCSFACYLVGKLVLQAAYLLITKHTQTAMGLVDQDSTSNAVGVLREQHLRSDFVSSSEKKNPRKRHGDRHLETNNSLSEYSLSVKHVVHILHEKRYINFVHIVRISI